MEKFKKYNIVDIAMLQTLIISLAFKDYTMITLISQIIAFLIISFNFLKKKKFKVKLDLYFVSKILFLLFCMVSGIWAFNGASVTFACRQIIFRFMMGITIIMYNDDEININKFLKFVLIASIVLCGRILIVVPFSAWGQERVGNYLAHDVGNSYSNTGITYVLGFAIAFLMCNEKVIKKNKNKFLIIILFSFFSFLSGSKKQIILLLISIIVYTFYKSKNTKKLIKNLLIAIIISVIMLYIILNNTFFYNIIGNRMYNFLSYFSSNEDINSNADMSTIGRSKLLVEARDTFFNNPILGIGIGNFMNVSSYGVWAENNYLELLADVGIIGLLIYYFGQVIIFNHCMINRKKKEVLNIQIIIGLLCFIVIDFTMVSYFNSTLQIYQAYIFAMYNVVKIKNIKYEGKKELSK